MPSRYEQVKAQGLCGVCRKQPAAKERSVCPSCLQAASDRRLRIRYAHHKRLMDKYGQQCFYCCRTLELIDYTVDHYHPTSKKDTYDGDIDEFDNLRLACDFCNKHKGNNIITDLDEFRVQVQARIEHLWRII